MWGLDGEGEIQGVARESGIPNLFFLVGNLSAARISSKVLALQIKAQQLDVFPERCTCLNTCLSDLVRSLLMVPGFECQNRHDPEAAGEHQGG